MDLDEIDSLIINELIKNGCSSLRELAIKSKLSPPGVNRRLKRMKDAGIIKGTTVILDRKKISGGISVFILIKCDPPYFGDFITELSRLEEAGEVYKISGSYNFLIKVDTDSVNTLTRIMSKLENIKGVEGLNTFLINDYLKTISQAFVKSSKLYLKCEFCGKEITGKPYELKFMDVNRFFCCPTCLGEFKKKYQV